METLNRKSRIVGTLTRYKKEIIMKISLITMVVITISAQSAYAGDGGQTLHTNTDDKWSQCSFVLDQSLTQEAWHQFAKEVGNVVYYRPMTSAKPMGKGIYHIGITNMSSSIDDSDPAWNDTFSHPESDHWLMKGDALGFPGLEARMGYNDKIDIGLYFMKSPGANYGFYGAQLQYNLINNLENGLAAAVRASFVQMFGPEDLNQGIYGLDLLLSKDVNRFSPYAGISTYLARAQATTSKVSLDDENILGVQGMVGVTTNVSFLKIGAEMNFAEVNTTSLLIGYDF